MRVAVVTLLAEYVRRDDQTQALARHSSQKHLSKPANAGVCAQIAGPDRLCAGAFAGWMRACRARRKRESDERRPIARDRRTAPTGAHPDGVSTYCVIVDAQRRGASRDFALAQRAGIVSR
jgi:hypothetical protein